MYSISPVVTVAAGALTWLFGKFLVRKIKILSTYNLPAPVIGGLVVAIFFAFLHRQGWNVVKFDSQLVPAMMIGFFTSLGYGASIQELKRGGKGVFVFFVACTVLLVIQVLVGALVAYSFGEPPLFGVLTGNVALVGGPGTALSFAKTFEEAGVKGAAAAGLSAAMLGIILGGILGGPIATTLIKKHNLHGRGKTKEVDTESHAASIPSSELTGQLIYHFAIVLIVGAIGSYLSKFIESQGIKLPFYIGSMVAASIVRNIEDRYKIFRIREDFISAIGEVNLTLFIAVSMMTLELWSVAAVAGPLLINLGIQTAIICIVAFTIMFRVSGKDYDGAVISGGMIGFMLGTTANALATMKAVTDRYGPAPRAFLVVPLVGACFIDFVNAIAISISINLLH